MLLGWSRAILLQLAHPLVAAGVAEHSTFREGRLAAALRLHGTVKSMLSLTFGGEAARNATLAHIAGIHRRVNGTLTRAAGSFPAGTRYSAEDPALLLWVHATLLESIPLAYHELVRPVTREEHDQYCREAAPVARALGAGQDVPESWADLRAYLERTYASGAIAVSDAARDVAAAVLAPPLAWMVAPAARLNHLVTVGWLPPVVRAQYGFTWTEEDARALRRWTHRIRRVRGLLPDWLALWPESRR